MFTEPSKWPFKYSSLVLKSIITSFVLEYLVEEIGGIGAILVAVAGAVIAGGIGPNGFSLGQLPTAETLMKSVSVVSKTMNLENQMRAEDLAEEYEITSANIDQRQEELDAANELLNVGTPGNPHLITNAIFSSDFNEDPDSYFERTLNQNAGILTLEAVSNYHDSALELPKANATDRILFG